jgi:hypothetical protein
MEKGSIMKSSYQLIEPSLAEIWLQSRNDLNRPISQALVDKYARDMASNRWEDNGQTIVFDETGKLVDGQHRLAAIVRSGVPLRIIVVNGVAIHAQATIDSGRSRTVRDNLNMRGTKNALGLASAARILLALKHDSPSYKATNSEILEFIESRKSFAPILEDLSKGFPVPVSSLGAWYYLAMLTDEELAKKALKTISFGVPSYEFDPMHMVRERIIRDRGRKSMGSAMNLYLMYAHAWNLYRKARPLSVVYSKSEMVYIDGFDYIKI